MSIAINSSLASAIDQDGYAIVEGTLPNALLRDIQSAVDGAQGSDSVRRRGGSTYAIRNLLEVAPKVRTLIDAPELRGIVHSVLGSTSRLTRAILFDKSPQANWSVGWHQDTTIAVAQKTDTPEFGPWSMKAGVVHVQPPTRVLENMLTARVHLDDCDRENGALMVLPGSHQHGLMDQGSIDQWRSQHNPVTCAVNSGGVLLMKPLLLHSSASSHSPRRRRVIHLEFSAAELPGALRWADLD